MQKSQTWFCVRDDRKLFVTIFNAENKRSPSAFATGRSDWCKVYNAGPNQPKIEVIYMYCIYMTFIYMTFIYMTYCITYYLHDVYAKAGSFQLTQESRF